MKGFNFEKNLQHQSQAVKTTVKVFDSLEVEKAKGVDKQFLNPILNIYDSNNTYPKNIIELQKVNNIDGKVNLNSNIIDIMMETGTGKTHRVQSAEKITNPVSSLQKKKKRNKKRMLYQLCE